MQEQGDASPGKKYEGSISVRYLWTARGPVKVLDAADGGGVFLRLMVDGGVA